MMENRPKKYFRLLFLRVLFGLTFVTVTLGCLAPQVFSSSQTHSISLLSGQLENAGLAFITPSTSTGQEQDKQSLALTFSEELAKARPNIPIVRLAETLGSINRNNFTEDYKKMYADYTDTGIFSREILGKVGEVTGSRFLAQLKLANFKQGTQGRFGLLGLRMIDTRYANIRVFLQIWDSVTGTIAWEGDQEINYSNDTFTDKPINFKMIVEETTRALIKDLP